MNIFDIKKCVSLGTMKAKRVKEGGEFSKPFPRILLDAIEIYGDNKCSRGRVDFGNQGVAPYRLFLAGHREEKHLRYQVGYLPLLCDCKSN